MALYQKSFNGRSLREMDASYYLARPEEKQSYVTFMFSLLAPGYDAFTRVFSFGMDRRWKQTLVREVAARVTATARVTDLACGTGDVVGLLRRELPGARLLALDISPEMVRIASHRHRSAAGPGFIVGDVSSMSLASGTMSAVTIGYGLRNLPYLEVGLSEIHRILAPGGVLAVLDFFRPGVAAWRRAFLIYLFVAGSLAGWIWHGDPSTFAYIARSIRNFVTIDDCLRLLERSGFRPQLVDRRLGGGIGLLVAQKTTR